MKKALRYIARILVGALIFLAAGWLLLSVYLLWKKPDLLKKARTELSKRVGGALTIGGLDLSFFRHFPYITLELSNVGLRDSLWQEHHHDLLQAEHLYLRFSLWNSLFAGHLRVEKVYMERGSVYLYTDSTGYSNTTALRSRNGGAADKEASPPDISLDHVRVTIEKIQGADKSKLFDFSIRQFDCTIEKNENSLQLRINARALINNFSFNQDKGSFLKNKELSGRFRLEFNTASKILQGNRVKIWLDGYPFLLSGRFFPNVSPDPFLLNIQTGDIPYRKAAALLTPHLQEKLDQYDIDRHISLNVSLDAGSADDHTPQIVVRTKVSHATVTTPAGVFAGASFDASFTNEWVRGQLREDENSGIRLLSFRGDWEKIPLRSDTINITDLKHPLLSCDLHSALGLEQLNDLSGSKTIRFLKGSCALKVMYTGPLSENDSTAVTINGSLDLDSAAIEYLPHRFRLVGGKGSLRFKGQDVFIDHLEAHAGSSTINLKGVAKNLVSLIDKNTGNLSMDWAISSPQLDLQDLSALLEQPVEAAPKKTGKAPFGTAASRVDRLLKEGAIRLQLQAGELHYGNFSGAHASADLLFDDGEVRLTHMEVEQGGGSLSLSSVLHRGKGGDASPVTLESHIDQVDLPKIFASFNDFGQDALSGKNLKGKLTADIRMTGLLNDQAKLVQNSLNGTVDFTIKNGELLNFEPMEKIHASVLKNRDLSGIRFAELRNRLEVDSTLITIHRMEIQSTAFSLFVEGTYDLKKGADMSVQVPLSNLKNKNQDIPADKKANEGKLGPSVRLRVRTGEDGKLKISWDPFKKALRKEPVKKAKPTKV